MSRQEKAGKSAATAETAAENTAAKIKAERMMTAEQFFRQNPRPAWLVALAKSAFKGKVTTESEWRRNVDALCRKKITG